MDKTIEQIEKYFEIIEDYFASLYYMKELTAFQKQEVRFFMECLNYIDLNKLPLTKEYIKECIEKQKQNMEDNDFISKSYDLYIKIVNKIYETKPYNKMSGEEQAVSDSFCCCFPCAIDDQYELTIELSFKELLRSNVKPGTILDLLYKHFKDIIDNAVKNNKTK